MAAAFRWALNARTLVYLDLGAFKKSWGVKIDLPHNLIVVLARKYPELNFFRAAFLHRSNKPGIILSGHNHSFAVAVPAQCLCEPRTGLEFSHCEKSASVAKYC